MEKFYTNKITINKEQNSKRLDQALTILLGKYSRSQIKNFIINQYIKKAGKFVTDVSLKVKQGEKYNIKIPNINYFGTILTCGVILGKNMMEVVV